MKLLFVVPCLFSKEHPHIYSCIDSIKKFYPESDIVIIDSGSSDKSYFERISGSQIKIEDINNKNYDSGAYWYAYKKYKKFYDFFYFIHDSTILNSKFNIDTNNRFYSIRYFYSFNGMNDYYGHLNNICKFIKIFFNKFNINLLEIKKYGFDSENQKKWVEDHLKLKKLKVPKFFTGLFGPMMIIRADLMGELEALGLDKILPSDKEQQKGMERIWGIFLEMLNVNITKQSLQGNHLKKSSLSQVYIEKIILNRT